MWSAWAWFWAASNASFLEDRSGQAPEEESVVQHHLLAARAADFLLFLSDVTDTDVLAPVRLVQAAV